MTRVVVEFKLDLRKRVETKALKTSFDSTERAVDWVERKLEGDDSMVRFPKHDSPGSVLVNTMKLATVNVYEVDGADSE